MSITSVGEEGGRDKEEGGSCVAEGFVEGWETEIITGGESNCAKGGVFGDGETRAWLGIAFLGDVFAGGEGCIEEMEFTVDGVGSGGVGWGEEEMCVIEMGAGKGGVLFVKTAEGEPDVVVGG